MNLLSPSTMVTIKAPPVLESLLHNRADSFYDRDEYSEAVDLYGKAITADGCRDGVVLYRYAYSLEQDEGMSLRVRNLYLQAWVRLKEQYPGHRYIETAENKLEG